MTTKELETTRKIFNEADEAFFGTVAKVADANDAFSKAFLILTHTSRVATDPEQASDILEAIHRFVSALDADAAEQCHPAR